MIRLAEPTIERTRHPGDAQPLPEDRCGFPTRKQFSADGLAQLRVHGEHGGMDRWANEFGLPRALVARRPDVVCLWRTLALPRARAPLGQVARVEGREDERGPAGEQCRRRARRTSYWRGRRAVPAAALGRLGLAAVIVRERPDAVGGRMRCSGSMLTREAEVVSRQWDSGGEVPLKRAISRRLLLLLVVGDVLGAGIYALVGQVGARTGGAIWTAFLVALGLALFTACAYAELVTKYPQAAGAALYVNRAFHRPSAHVPRRVHGDGLRLDVGSDAVARVRRRLPVRVRRGADRPRRLASSRSSRS